MKQLKNILITGAFFAAPILVFAAVMYLATGANVFAIVTTIGDGINWSELNGALLLIGLFLVGACIGNLSQAKKQRELRRQEELRRIELEQELARMEYERKQEEEYQKLVAYNQMLSTPRK